MDIRYVTVYNYVRTVGWFVTKVAVDFCWSFLSKRTQLWCYEWQVIYFSLKVWKWNSARKQILDGASYLFKDIEVEKCQQLDQNKICNKQFTEFLNVNISTVFKYFFLLWSEQRGFTCILKQIWEATNLCKNYN